eukprot:Amastigsp_a676834_30.p3 type:complete len:194 gc:universal Amastigsp_a676834_30:609-1190(+)
MVRRRSSALDLDSCPESPSSTTQQRAIAAAQQRPSSSSSSRTRRNVSKCATVTRSRKARWRMSGSSANPNASTSCAVSEPLTTVVNASGSVCTSSRIARPSSHAIRAAVAAAAISSPSQGSKSRAGFKQSTACTPGTVTATTSDGCSGHTSRAATKCASGMYARDKSRVITKARRRLVKAIQPRRDRSCSHRR